MILNQGPFCNWQQQCTPHSLSEQWISIQEVCSTCITLGYLTRALFKGFATGWWISSSMICKNLLQLTFENHEDLKLKWVPALLCKNLPGFCSFHLWSQNFHMLWLFDTLDHEALTTNGSRVSFQIWKVIRHQAPIWERSCSYLEYPSDCSCASTLAHLIKFWRIEAYQRMFQNWREGPHPMAVDVIHFWILYYIGWFIVNRVLLKSSRVDDYSDMIPSLLIA